MRGYKEFARAAAAGAVLGAALLTAGAASANIVYTVDQIFGDGSVKGTLETDGTTGFLGAGDFVSWNLTLTGTGGASFVLTDANSGVFISGQDVSASATGITFDYDAAGENYFLIEGTFGAGSHYWCNSSQTGTCFQGKSSVPESFDSPSAVYVAASGSQIIATSGVPEPATWALVLAGFAGVSLAAFRRARAIAADA